MSNITKIKIDGVEHQIGYGAELEWKEVSYGRYHQQSSETEIIYWLDTPLNPSKIYYIERYDASMEHKVNFLFKADCYQYTRLLETDNDSLTDVVVNYSTFNNEYWLRFSSTNGNIGELYQSEDDVVQVFELSIKNVVNPSNVETPNKMKLVATGTWESNAFVLDNKLEWNKTYLYNIEYDPNSINISGVLPLFNLRNYEEYHIDCVGMVYDIQEDNPIEGKINYHSRSNEIIMTINGDDAWSDNDIDDLKIYIYELPFTL